MDKIVEASESLESQIELIAKKHLGIDTLKSRGSDSKDFHDVNVIRLKNALLMAYKLGFDKATTICKK